MKRLLLSITTVLLLASCSQEEFENPTQETADLSFYDNSNLGTYKGVFASETSEARATIEIRISEGTNQSTNRTNLSAATIKFVNGETYFVRSNTIVTEGTAINNLIFYSEDISFLFSVNADGSDPSITDVSYKGDASHIIVAKDKQSNPVTAVTGTYDCGSCNGHPLLSSNTTKTFNFLISGSGVSNIRTVATQSTLGTIVYNGIGIENNCQTVDGSKKCTLESGDLISNVGYYANGNPVTWTATITTGVSPVVIAPPCSELVGTWQWPSNGYGIIEGTFSTDTSCN